ncbi:MAG TPA: sigma-70 family RNA polymerase sigma factor [Pseudonocardiaceae bacterium]|jgi:RNA polymerase sigma-70 factor (ECF subfamily)|nr:sigma-70 family RNA polymerase sigma factor [Pseudonocardiaceae bacterium]
MDRREALTVHIGVKASLDDESAQWLRTLSARRADALSELHALLLRAARHELHRRAPRTLVTGSEADDLAYQAAADAMVAILGKLSTFRGESRFTTWAYRFVILEVSAKLGRHHWRANPTASLPDEEWARLPDRFGLDPTESAEAGELLAALRRAVDETLTDHQRRMFVAVVVNGVPLDALVARLGVNRNAVYKTVFDARRKIRAFLVTNGLMTDTAEGRP